MNYKEGDIVLAKRLLILFWHFTFDKHYVVLGVKTKLFNTDLILIEDDKGTVVYWAENRFIAASIEDQLIQTLKVT